MLDSPRPVPGPIGALLGRLGEPFYALVVGRRNAAFDRGAGVQRAAVPVVSVGNLSVGGTGKTPIVAWLARALAAGGFKPAVAMRGYMPARVAGGAVGGGSDEAREYAAMLPGVPILVNPDRAAAIAERLAAAPGALDAVVLDDGFQHRRLHRDADVVLIDATRDPFADRLLPAGWLREPVASLRRAQAIVLTHAEAVAPSVVDRIAAQVRGVIGRGPTAVVRHEWGGLEGVPGGDAVGPLEWLKGKRLMVACAIGNPWPFVQAAQRAGEVREQIVLRDHDPFAPATVERMITAARRIRAEAIVVTGKDWTKLSQAGVAWPCPVLRPVLRLRFERGEQELARMVAEALGKARAAAPGPTGT